MTDARQRAARQGGMLGSGLGLAGAVLLAGPAIAQPEPLAITPADSVELGLAHSPALQRSQADLDAARAAEDLARSGLLPSLEIQANYTYLGGDIGNVEFTVPGLDTAFEAWPIVRHRVHTEAQLNQPLFRGNQLRNQRAAAELERRAAEAFLAQAEADQIYLIHEAWWELFRARALVRAAQAAAEQIEAHLSEVEARRAEGAALLQDLLAARTRRAEVRLERLEAQHGVEVWRRELLRRLGLPPETEVHTGFAMELAIPEESLEEALLEAELGRPELVGLALQAEARQREVAVQRGRLLPELSAFGRGVWARPNSYFFNAQDEFRAHYELGLRLMWIVWEGGAGRARIREAQARYRQAQAQLQEARQSAGAEVTRRVLELQRTVAAVELGRQAVAEARETLRVTRAQYVEGAALASEVLDAERAVWQAEASVANAMADHALARAALLRAQGKGD